MEGSRELARLGELRGAASVSHLLPFVGTGYVALKVSVNSGTSSLLLSEREFKRASPTEDGEYPTLLKLYRDQLQIFMNTLVPNLVVIVILINPLLITNDFCQIVLNLN